MKRFLLTCALLCAFCSLQAADIAGITQAFKAGKAETLAGKMAEKIDLALPEKTLENNQPVLPLEFVHTVPIQM